MQIDSARLGLVYWCRLAVIIFGLAQAPLVYGQAPLETQAQTNDRIRSLSAATTTPVNDYVIGRGDLVSLEVFDIPELSREVRVSQSGTIGIPLVPVRLYVVGLNEMQVQQKVAEVLEANGLVSHPQVMVSVKEKRSKPITVVGAVTHPMVYQADHAVSLVQVLAEAGGIAPDAGDTVIITRGETADEISSSNEPPEIGPEDKVSATNPSAPSVAPDAAPTSDAAAIATKPSANAQPATAGAKDTPSRMGTQSAGSASPPPIGTDATPLANVITVNLAELLERGNTQNNVLLQAGDIITIPHAGIVYALGAVQRPGAYVSNNDRAQLSTLKVLALAGGMTRIAKKDRAMIIRKDAMGKQIAIPIDLAKIIGQKAEDIRMMPSDILYVPDNNAKAALIRASEIALTIGTGLAVYRFAR